MTRKLLLLSGILAALHQVAINVYVPTRWNGYDAVSQTVSELSAIGAPTRALWLGLASLYTPLLFAFGCGVWKAAGGGRALRVAGGALVFQAVLGVYWPPMHLRGHAMTATDVLHIAWSVAVLAGTLVAMLAAARALGGGFRRFTLATLAVFLVFGALTGLGGSRLAANLPTPWLGVWERILMAAMQLWNVALAVALWPRGGETGARPRPVG